MSTLTISKEELKALYDKDFPLWAEINLELLKEKLYDMVDWENLLEEFDYMSKADLRACVSYLAIILEHMYKLDHFKDIAGGEIAGKGWIKSIKNARDDLNAVLDDYPSLKSKLPLELQKAWKYAVINLKKWLRDNDIDEERFSFPKGSPYTYEEALFRSF